MQNIFAHLTLKSFFSYVIFYTVIFLLWCPYSNGVKLTTIFIISRKKIPVFIRLYVSISVIRLWKRVSSNLRLYKKLPILNDSTIYAEVLYGFVKIRHMTFVRWFQVKSTSFRYYFYDILSILRMFYYYWAGPILGGTKVVPGWHFRSYAPHRRENCQIEGTMDSMTTCRILLQI